MHSYAVVLRRSAVATVPAFLVTIAVPLILIVKFGDATAVSGKALGLLAVACAFTWVTAQALITPRLKARYVEPIGKR